MYTLEGVSSVANFITAYKESQKPRLQFVLSVVCFSFPKAIFLMFVILMYTIEGVSSVANFITAYEESQ